MYLEIYFFIYPVLPPGVFKGVICYFKPFLNLPWQWQIDRISYLIENAHHKLCRDDQWVFNILSLSQKQPRVFILEWSMNQLFELQKQHIYGIVLDNWPMIYF